MYLIATARTDEAKARLAALENTDDGFELAEYDLQLRHEGDVLGCRQHGYPALKLVDVIRDRDLIDEAHADARELVDDDPELVTPGLAPLRAEVGRKFAGVSMQADGA